VPLWLQMTLSLGVVALIVGAVWDRVLLNRRVKRGAYTNSEE
jgi:hypothetical protein